MGTLKIQARLDVSGPLADGRADRAVEEWQRNTTQAIGDEGVQLLRAVHMDKTGRAHGAFQASLKVVRKSPAEVRIPGATDRGVVWAPWLEGVTKRNDSTGFKGYGLFRKTRNLLNKRAAEIGQRELDKLMPRIGGGL